MHKKFSLQFIKYINKILHNSYRGEWYESSPKSRKLLNVMMLRSISPCTLTVGKIMVLSLPSFNAVRLVNLICIIISLYLMTIIFFELPFSRLCVRLPRTSPSFDPYNNLNVSKIFLSVILLLIEECISSCCLNNRRMFTFT